MRKFVEKEVFALQLSMLIDGILLNGSVKKVISGRLQQRIFLRELGVEHQVENVLYQAKRLSQ